MTGTASMFKEKKIEIFEKIEMLTHVFWVHVIPNYAFLK